MDWGDLQYFLAVADHGSLTAAADRLGVRVSTASRRLQAFQDALKTRLFIRDADGYKLTAAGAQILAFAKQASHEVVALQDILSGYSDALVGSVRIAASPSAITNFIVPAIPAIHADGPDISIELINDMPGEPLATREAEICLRFSAFEHSSLIVRKVGTVQMGTFASKAYIARQGEPCPLNGFAGHRIVAQLPDRGDTAQFRWLNRHATQATVVCRTNSYEAMFTAAAEGSCIALLPKFYARKCHDLQEVRADLPLEPLDLWLGTHEGSRAMRRVRFVADQIAKVIRTKLSH